VTGYLKLSISVLGPKDKPKIHDPEEEERKEREAGNDKTLCLMPPSIKRYTQYLVREPSPACNWNRTVARARLKGRSATRLP
jgi:hypothetical protein